MKNKKLSAFSFIELSIVILIIGILVAGIVSSSRLVGQYRITSARNTSSSSSIASISGMILWLDVVAENKITNTSDVAPVDGDRVKTWVDANPQSTTPITFSQPAAGTGPVYESDGINNLPTLYYQGTASGGTGTWDHDSDNGTAAVSSAGCLTNGSYDSTINPGRFTAFIVFQPLVDVSSNTGSIYSSVGSNTGFSLVKAATKLTANFGTGSGVKALHSVSTALRNSYIMSMTRSATTSNYYLNGAVATTSSTGAEDAATLTALTVAAYTANSTAATGVGCAVTPGLYFNGYISEVILFDRDLKAEERRSVESYLSKKYGVRVSVS
jgi:hypothetical protein